MSRDYYTNFLIRKILPSHYPILLYNGVLSLQVQNQTSIKLESEENLKKKKRVKNMSGRIYIVPLAILLTMVGLFVCDNQVLAQVCGINDLSTLQAQCLKFVQKSGPSENPSQGCCKEVREIDVQCVCDDLLSDNSIAQLLINQLNLEKVVSVAKFCGKQLPSGKKCGSKLIFFLKRS